MKLLRAFGIAILCLLIATLIELLWRMVGILLGISGIAYSLVSLVIVFAVFVWIIFKRLKAAE